MVRSWGNGMSAPELARHLEVSTRTIYRDVEALGTAGIPVYLERGANGGIRLLEGYRTDLTGLSPGEAEALFLMGVPGPLDKLGLSPELPEARRKLLAALPQGRHRLAERLHQRIHVDTTSWDQGPPHAAQLATVARAVLTDRRLALVYVRADNREVNRSVDPLGLALKGGIWYLVALFGRWDTVYRVSRIRSAELVDEPARRPYDFDLAAYWAAWVEDLGSRRAEVTVHVRLGPEAAAELPRRLGEALRTQILQAGAAPQILRAGAAPAGAIELALVFESVEDARLYGTV